MLVLNQQIIVKLQFLMTRIKKFSKLKTLQGRSVRLGHGIPKGRQCGGEYDLRCQPGSTRVLSSRYSSFRGQNHICILAMSYLSRWLKLQHYTPGWYWRDVAVNKATGNGGGSGYDGRRNENKIVCTIPTIAYWCWWRQ